MTSDDQAENMPFLVTSTPSLEEQMQELQQKLAEKEAKIANLATALRTGSVRKLIRLVVATQSSLRKISRSWSLMELKSTKLL